MYRMEAPDGEPVLVLLQRHAADMLSSTRGVPQRRVLPHTGAVSHTTRAMEPGVEERCAVSHTTRAMEPGAMEPGAMEPGAMAPGVEER